jgi:hypothetical protein
MTNNMIWPAISSGTVFVAARKCDEEEEMAREMWLLSLPLHNDILSLYLLKLLEEAEENSVARETILIDCLYKRRAVNSLLLTQKMNYNKEAAFMRVPRVV